MICLKCVRDQQPLSSQPRTHAWQSTVHLSHDETFLAHIPSIGASVWSFEFCRYAICTCVMAEQRFYERTCVPRVHLHFHTIASQQLTSWSTCCHRICVGETNLQKLCGAASVYREQGVPHSVNCGCCQQFLQAAPGEMAEPGRYRVHMQLRELSRQTYCCGLNCFPEKACRELLSTVHQQRPVSMTERFT